MQGLKVFLIICGWAVSISLLLCSVYLGLSNDGSWPIYAFWAIWNGTLTAAVSNVGGNFHSFVPGFRSHDVLKQAVAIPSYLVIGLFAGVIAFPSSTTPPSLTGERDITQLPTATMTTLAFGMLTPTAISTNTPKPIPTVTPTAMILATPSPTETPKPSPTSQAFLIHKIGETVEVQGHTIQAVSVNRDSDISVEVLLTNNERATEPLSVSFDTMYLRDNEGKQYPYVYPKTGGWFSGKVLPGDKLRGSVEFLVDKSAKGLRFYYRPSRYSSKNTIVFSLDEHTPLNSLPIPSWIANSKSTIKGSKFQVGESVNIDGLAVRVSSVQLIGNKAIFEVTIYNGSATDRELVLEDIFSCKDADSNQGQLLRTFLYTDTGGLPGSSIIRGDISRGTLTFDFKKPLIGSPRLYVVAGINAAIFSNDN